jgi:hypothetical protein
LIPRFYFRTGLDVSRLRPVAGMRVNKINTLLRGVYTLGWCFILSQVALAQSSPAAKSVLNFVKTTVNDQSNVGFAVTNPTTSYADVQFTFYGLDGNPASSGLAVNPVRYRVAPRGQISMLARDLFAASAVDGWVQATSSSAGLTGSYLVGDFAQTLQGAAPATELSTQVVPLLRQDANNDTTLVVLNPYPTGNSSVTVSFYGPGGQQLATTSVTLGPHAAQRIQASSITNLSADNFSARIVSSIPVVATALVRRSNGLLFAPGQPVDQPAALRMAPHFLNGNGFDPILVLANPNNSPVTVTLRLVGADGGPVDASLQGPTATSFTIPANGLISKKTNDILGRPFIIPLTIDGWLRIESQNVALDGLLILDETTTVSSLPLQTNAQTQVVYSEIFENQSTVTELMLVNSTAANANVDLFLLQSDGTTVAQSTITLPANSKSTKLVRDLLPDVLNQAGSYVLVRSSVPVYSTALVVAGTTFLANVPPGPVSVGFVPDTAGTTPRIRLESGSDVPSGSRIRVAVMAASSDDALFTVGSQIVPIVQRVSAIAGVFDLQLPALEAGYVYLRVHANGADSPAVALHVLPPDNSPTQSISGTALYQKIDLTDSGLDLSHPVMFPIRNARVEVVNSISQALVSVSETDARGRFTVAVPFDPNLTIRVLSRIRSFDLRVADNTNLNAPYAISANVDGRSGNSNLVVTDTSAGSRVSGAFNILEVI